MSKKSCPICKAYKLYQNGQDFLDTQVFRSINHCLLYPKDLTRKSNIFLFYIYFFCFLLLFHWLALILSHSISFFCLCLLSVSLSPCLPISLSLFSLLSLCFSLSFSHTHTHIQFLRSYGQQRKMFELQIEFLVGRDNIPAFPIFWLDEGADIDQVAAFRGFLVVVIVADFGCLLLFGFFHPRQKSQHDAAKIKMAEMRHLQIW